LYYPAPDTQGKGNMKYKFDDRVDDEYGLDDEFQDQKRYRRNKRSGGKHHRDSFEARDARFSRYDDWN
jgi:hypothetical protein